MTKEERKRKAMEREYAWREKYPERYRERMRRYYLQNRERVIARSIKWAEEHRERYEENQKSWRKRTSEKRCHEAVKRRGVCSSATPAWANDFFISEIYRLARLRTKVTGFKWHVDHIVPLNSKYVCGLHVENNLQVIPASDNFKKRNVTWPQMSWMGG